MDSALVMAEYFELASCWPFTKPHARRHKTIVNEFEAAFGRAIIFAIYGLRMPGKAR
jgi:hypothetical protein